MKNELFENDLELLRKDIKKKIESIAFIARTSTSDYLYEAAVGMVRVYEDILKSIAVSELQIKEEHDSIERWAIIFVDGEEHAICKRTDDYYKIFEETVKNVGGEVALVVYKPAHKGYNRERMVIGAPVQSSNRIH